MNAAEMLQAIKSHPDYHKAGMVLCHNGVVRATSRDGRPVSGLSVAVDQAGLEAVIDNARRTPGIVDVQVRIAANRPLEVGDDVMLLVVAGDIRENVLRTLEDTLNAIKTTVTAKTEFYLD